jgi:hypothetical protein
VTQRKTGHYACRLGSDWESANIAGGGVRLVFEAAGGTAGDFVVQGSAAVGGGSAWKEEADARISTTEPGRFQVELPQRESIRFYRVRALP